MTEAWFREIKKDLPNHPKLAKSMKRLGKFYEISSTTMDKVVKARNWVHYLELTKVVYDRRFGKKPGTVPMFNESKPEATTPAVDKSAQVHADAVDEKPKSVAAVAAAVAHSVVERELAKRVQSAGVVVKYAPGITMKTSITNGVTIIDLTPDRKYWLVKTLAMAMVAVGSVLLILPYLGR